MQGYIIRELSLNSLNKKLLLLNELFVSQTTIKPYNKYTQKTRLGNLFKNTNNHFTSKQNGFINIIQLNLHKS